MLSKWLKEITDIPGIEGVVLVSNQGDIIDNIGTQFERTKQEQIALHLLKMCAINRIDQKSLNEIEIIWNEQRIFTISSDLFLLIVFCGNMKNMSLLRITASVVISYILDDKKAMKQVKKHHSDLKNVIDSEELDQIEINFISKLQ